MTPTDWQAMVPLSEDDLRRACAAMVASPPDPHGGCPDAECSPQCPARITGRPYQVESGTSEP